MHYLTHGPAFAIVEDDAQAAKHVAAGWTLATLDAVRALWLIRDLDAYDRLWEELLTKEREAQAKGAGPTETAPLKRTRPVVVRQAGAWTMYDARKEEQTMKKLPTHEMLKYMAAHRGAGDVIDSPAGDPVLLQAQQDGYADWVDGQWIGRGYIAPGERRIVRHTYGGPSEVVGGVDG